MSHEDFALPNAELAQRLALLRQANATAARAAEKDSPLDIVRQGGHIESRSQLARRQLHLRVHPNFIDLLRVDPS